ncbi:hypothetical protein WJX74_003474 [Apatococcus lobatus]|uniref:Serine/threonine-protein phosphatase 2A activator n=1 Tax=Apatococcus lobatus TaxID=904363 RepID=A0AAW1QVV3_9CHLO
MTVDGDPAPGLGPEVGTRPWRPLWSSVSRSPQPQLGSENFSVHSARSGRNDLAVDMEPIKASWTSGPTQQPSKQSPGTTSRSSTHFVTSRAAFPKQQQLNPGYEKMGSPEKLIKSQADLARFLVSDAAREFVGFVLSLNESVKGRKVSDPCLESAPVKGLLALLSELSAWVDLIPPVTTSLRYGNPAFRDWHARLESQARLPICLNKMFSFTITLGSQAQHQQ